MAKKNQKIRNINIGETYDKRFEGADIHVDSLRSLSDFFGRDMPAHKHDLFYQIHWLEKGHVDVTLNGNHYQGSAPLFFFTPPANPHAFTLDPTADGLVLTVRQELVHRLLEGSEYTALKQHFSSPHFVSLSHTNIKQVREKQNFPVIINMLAEEFFEQETGRKYNLQALLNLVLMSILRLSKTPHRSENVTQEAANIYSAFSELIEQHHAKQWSIQDYCEALNITQSRLYDICQRITAMPPKQLIHDRQIKEARWQLIYTATAINTIASDLGFNDPAYFCRFFTKHTGLSPRAFRNRALEPSGGIEL